MIPKRRVTIAGGSITPFIGKFHPDFIWKKHPDFGQRENPTLEQLLHRVAVGACSDVDKTRLPCCKTVSRRRRWALPRIFSSPINKSPVDRL